MKHTITFTIETEDADPSSILDAAESAIEDLLGHLEAVSIEAVHIDDGTSPSVEAKGK